ncbi:MAG: DUF1992 domain-containing protein [Chloroflexi bacterium]|nr:DUF1992 domain-containing protein [Chloroflexota bacterium]
MDLGKVVEQLLREAQAEGKFDNLPGKGCPLRLEDNPYEDPQWRLANHVLKNAGYAPDWLAMDLELRQARERAQADVTCARQWRDETLARLAGRNDPAAVQDREWVRAEWTQARARFREALEAINRGLFELNLRVPLERLQRPRLDIAGEMQKWAAP